MTVFIFYKLRAKAESLVSFGFMFLVSDNATPPAAKAAGIALFGATPRNRDTPQILQFWDALETPRPTPPMSPALSKNARRTPSGLMIKTAMRAINRSRARRPTHTPRGVIANGSKTQRCNPLECGGKAKRRHRFERFAPGENLTLFKAVSPVACAPFATALQNNSASSRIPSNCYQLQYTPHRAKTGVRFPAFARNGDRQMAAD
ncbi:hypothetical protein M2447_001729 [Ereboglobus sp. PH5-10]|uniref:hypothetical protein n=1 Tax=Ereboglobus sp. PH5-10 TaxID=2940629 RepID=UPI00240653F0|nr:hypothetical protein [Ereboglobus sp. PH5-10]MDF9827630.1 hypothetical protein [Ereboglobus sp. PH5-10]